MQHILQLSGVLDAAGVTRILNALRTLPGVHGAEAAPGTRQVAVDFDQGRTSPQELGATAARAGFLPLPARHAGGSCCGGCGEGAG